MEFWALTNTSSFDSGQTKARLFENPLQMSFTLALTESTLVHLNQNAVTWSTSQKCAHSSSCPIMQGRLPHPRVGVSYREIMECWYIETFSISKSISYRTSNIEYLDILKTSDLFRLFSPKIHRTFRKFSETPKIQKIPRKYSENSKHLLKIQKILKICQKFLKKKVFFEAKISYREKNPSIVSLSCRVEKKLIAHGWPQHS